MGVIWIFEGVYLGDLLEWIKNCIMVVLIVEVVWGVLVMLIGSGV